MSREPLTNWEDYYRLWHTPLWWEQDPKNKSVSYGVTLWSLWRGCERPLWKVALDTLLLR